jgi:hypothetical protein
VLDVPYYFVHPCHSATLMRRIGSLSAPSSSVAASNSPRASSAGSQSSTAAGDSGAVVVARRPNALAQWLSMFGPVVGLFPSMQYFSALRPEIGSVHS